MPYKDKRNPKLLAYQKQYRTRPDLLARRTADTRRYRQTHPDRRKSARLWQGYKITLLEYYALLDSQGGACAICKGNPGKRTWFTVDHDHRCCPGKKSCGKCIRALLCSRCNGGLGLFLDNLNLLQNATQYMEYYV